MTEQQQTPGQPLDGHTIAAASHNLIGTTNATVQGLALNGLAPGAPGQP